DRTVACTTCHNPRLAFTDGKALPVGVRGQVGRRSAPTLINRAYGRSQFWDGRARTLEEQVLEPIGNPREMDLDVVAAVDRLAQSRDYRRRFRSVFGRAVNAGDLSLALASYLRTILAGNSSFDQFANGNRGALSDEAQRGLAIFRGKGGCSTCHSGPTLSDER